MNLEFLLDVWRGRESVFRWKALSEAFGDWWGLNNSSSYKSTICSCCKISNVKMIMLQDCLCSAFWEIVYINLRSPPTVSFALQSYRLLFAFSPQWLQVSALPLSWLSNASLGRLPWSFLHYHENPAPIWWHHRELHPPAWIRTASTKDRVRTMGWRNHPGMANVTASVVWSQKKPWRSWTLEQGICHQDLGTQKSAWKVLLEDFKARRNSQRYWGWCGLQHQPGTSSHSLHWP